MLGAIAGDIIGSVHDGGVPDAIASEALARLDERLRGVTRDFLETV